MVVCVNPSSFRLGASMDWNILGSQLHFNKSLRIQLAFNTMLEGYLEIFSYRLMKFNIIQEAHVIKIFVIAIRIVNDEPIPNYFDMRYSEYFLKMLGGALNYKVFSGMAINSSML